MPTPAMTPEEQKAYDRALEKIETCRRDEGKELNLSKFGLRYLPPEIGQLTALVQLELYSNVLSTLPPEIGKLKSLTRFYLFNNRFSALPPEIGKLTSLTRFDLDLNELSTLPPEMGKLTALTHLHLATNQLNTLPQEIGQLTALNYLNLNKNRFDTLPPEIGRFTALKALFASNNQLRTVPPEIVRLTALEELILDNNPLQDPPGSVATRGIEAMRRYFADKAGSGTEVLWRSKLMLVGQGRIGKTELRHRLMKRPHGQAVSTEVVEIETVPLLHPQKPNVTMELRCWDFGGQDIYHATHQFFLTGRSLFVFCFEAGKDWEAGRPYYWLDKIAAVAPDAPVIIVATKCDERP
ncbi:MAG TPA: GTPase, partial [Verrucomicrobiae bacterium]